MRLLQLGFGLLAALFLVAAPLRGQEGKQDPEALAKFAKPGPAHEQLAKRIGEYTTRTKFIAPGQPSEDTTGTAKITSLLDGRFIRTESIGKMMGRPVTSIHIDGFNNATNRYESVWMYTMSTSMMNLVGTSKDDGKTIDYTATYERTPGEKTTMQVFTRQIDDDSFVIELSAKTPEGDKGPTLEITYTRKR